MKTNVAQVGLDVHKSFSRLTERDALGKVVGRGRLDHRDRTRLRRRIGQWAVGTPVVLESTFGWGWLSDELLEAELDPHLANSCKVAAWRKARGIAKTDRTDADLLSELPLQSEPWWEVWLAPPAVRDQREWMRYRMTLVQMQTGLKNRIHAVLHRHGIVQAYSDLFGTAGRSFLRDLTASDDITLSMSGRMTLSGYLELLEQVRRMIAQVTRELRKQLNRAPEGERLRSLPGISWILGYVVFAEIGKIERFTNAKHLCSYSLLVPRAHETGDPGDEPPKGRHVGHVGRRTLKWAFIEGAHGAVRKSARFRAIFDKRTGGGKRDKNRGYIAVAHELCRMAYVIWTKQEMYSETVVARPGQRDRAGRSSKRRTSRSGMGQPDHPMVVAS
jgi:transposase